MLQLQSHYWTMLWLFVIYASDVFIAWCAVIFKSLCDLTEGLICVFTCAFICLHPRQMQANKTHTWVLKRTAYWERSRSHFSYFIFIMRESIHSVRSPRLCGRLYEALCILFRGEHYLADLYFCDIFGGNIWWYLEQVKHVKHLNVCFTAPEMDRVLDPSTWVRVHILLVRIYSVTSKSSSVNMLLE